MRKYNYGAELDLKTMSKTAYDYYLNSPWQVWKDSLTGEYWYGLCVETYGPYTIDQLNGIFEHYAEYYPE